MKIGARTDRITRLPGPPDERHRREEAQPPRDLFHNRALRKSSVRCLPEGDPSPPTKEQPRWPQ
jgi:hypothetical protein